MFGTFSPSYDPVGRKPEGGRLEIELITKGQWFNQSCLHKGTPIKIWNKRCLECIFIPPALPLSVHLRNSDSSFNTQLLCLSPLRGHPWLSKRSVIIFSFGKIQTGILKHFSFLRVTFAFGNQIHWIDPQPIYNSKFNVPLNISRNS